MSQFHNIDYAKLNFELVRNDLAVNKDEVISDFFKFLLCCTYPFQSRMADYYLWLVKQYKIAICDWTFGNVTNLLNMLFDSVDKRIYLNQVRLANTFDVTFSYPATSYDNTFADTIEIIEPTFSTLANVNAIVTVWLPSVLFNDGFAKQEIINTVEQIKLYGIDYQINEII